MGQMHLFTPKQQLVFDKIANKDMFRAFYFTGGTALSYFYLNHRYSEDLDFFSEEKADNTEILSFMQKFAQDANFTFRAELKEVVYMFYLTFKNGEILKVDFGYYPYKRVEKGQRYKNFQVDSLLDIAINKVSAINQRSSVKDFVDLYYLLNTFTIWDLIEGVRTKFHMEIDYWIFGSDLGFAIEKFETMPKMIRPLTLKRLKTFFHNLAMELGKKVIEK